MAHISFASSWYLIIIIIIIIWIMMMMMMTTTCCLNGSEKDGMVGVNVRKIEALTVKMETVRLIGKGR
jgi:ATP-dependent Zn protease